MIKDYIESFLMLRNFLAIGSLKLKLGLFVLYDVNTIEGNKKFQKNITNVSFSDSMWVKFLMVVVRQ